MRKLVHELGNIAGEAALRIPENLVITLDRVFQDEAVAELLTTNKLSELACLTLYLMYEKKNGRDSYWFEYIKVRNWQLIKFTIGPRARSAGANLWGSFSYISGAPTEICLCTGWPLCDFVACHWFEWLEIYQRDSSWTRHAPGDQYFSSSHTIGGHSLWPLLAHARIASPWSHKLQACNRNCRTANKRSAEVSVAYGGIVSFLGVGSHSGPGTAGCSSPSALGWRPGGRLAPRQPSRQGSSATPQGKPSCHLM